MKQQAGVHTNEKKQEMTLTEAFVMVAGLRCRYRLVAAEDEVTRITFRIVIATDCEETVALVGDDLWRATDWFERILAGRVTPCGLHDVVEDLWRMEQHL